MSVDFFILNFEIIIFISITLLIIGVIGIFFIQSYHISENKNVILDHMSSINLFSKEVKEYISGIGNILEQQKNEMLKQTEKIASLEREISRLSNLKGSEDTLGIAIEMARSGNSREQIKEETGLGEDEIEAIYTSYFKN